MLYSTSLNSSSFEAEELPRAGSPDFMHEEIVSYNHPSVSAGHPEKTALQFIFKVTFYQDLHIV